MDDDDGPGFTLTEADPPATPNGAAKGGKRRNGGVVGPRVRRDEKIALLLSEAALWRGEDGKAYASLPSASGGRLEHVLVMSAASRRWLRFIYFRRHGSALSGNAVEQAAGLAEAQALEIGPTRAVWRRFAFAEGRHWIDLCGGDRNGKRGVVELGPDGWRVVDEAPVAFLRGPDALPLPAPEPGEATPEDLLRFVNVGDGEGLVLAWTWLLCAARPFPGGEGKYPPLLLHGSHGSGKTHAARCMRALLDPAKSKSLGLPRDERDLFVSAIPRHVLAYDNVSALPDWLSDALCRIADFGTMSTKALYTDSDESLLSAGRPVLLNGIPPTILHRQDLAERAIVLECLPLRGRRRADEEIQADFERLRPGLLGLLCDGIVAALRQGGTKPPGDARRPADPLRMASAVAWAEAGVAGLGFAEGAVDAAWRANRDASTRESLAADDVAGAVLKLLGSHPDGWSGAPRDLYRLLCDQVDERVSRGQSWPKNASRMGAALKRIAPGLRETLGIDVAQPPRGTSRGWSIRRV